MKLTSEQITSLASGLESNNRNYKLIKTKRYRNRNYTDSKVSVADMYFKSKNFKLNGKPNRKKNVRVQV